MYTYIYIYIYVYAQMPLPWPLQIRATAVSCEKKKLWPIQDNTACFRLWAVGLFFPKEPYCDRVDVLNERYLLQPYLQQTYRILICARDLFSYLPEPGFHSLSLSFSLTHTYTRTHARTHAHLFCRERCSLARCRDARIVEISRLLVS